MNPAFSGPVHFGQRESNTAVIRDRGSVMECGLPLSSATVLPRFVGAVTRWMRAVGGLIAAALIAVIGLYQRLISPCLRPCCRFIPSCSVYAAESLRKHGLIKGAAKAAWRLARCQPFARGGLDEP